MNAPVRKQVAISGDPIPQQVISYCRSVAKTDEEFEREKHAYLDFCDRYGKERNHKMRIVMESFLQYLLFSNHHGMKPSYAFSEALKSALDQEKEANTALYPESLHEEIADILTTSTYTVGRGRSTNWTLHTGTPYSEFNGEGRQAFKEWTAGEILASYVKFGSHHFSIGSATQRMLAVIEDRYGIDFKELEKQRKTSGK